MDERAILEDMLSFLGDNPRMVTGDNPRMVTEPHRPSATWTQDADVISEDSRKENNVYFCHLHLEDRAFSLKQLPNSPTTFQG